MTWDDAEDIGMELYEKFPDTDPLTVRFTDLRNHVLELEGFEGDPAKSNEGKLGGHPNGVARGVEGQSITH